MTEAQQILEEQSNALLKGTPGVYTERQLLRQERTARQPQRLYSLYQRGQTTEEQQLFHEECIRATLQIARATTKDRTTLSMIQYRLTGMTYKRIAEIHECDTATVSRRIAKAQRFARSQPYQDIYVVIAEIFKLPVGLVRAYCLQMIR